MHLGLSTLCFQVRGHSLVEERLVKHFLLSVFSEFENLGVSVLDSCYTNDEEHAQLLTVHALQPFGWLTCMDIARLADDQDFIAHSSCQILFNRLWMGGMLLDTPWWKVNRFLFETTNRTVTWTTKY